MTTRRAHVGPLPNWPLYLSREEAAAYVGVSPSLFDIEVKAGKWPKAETRGLKDGRLTWYRPGLDKAAAVRNGEESDGAGFDTWRAGFAKGRENHSKAARGRQR